MKFNDWLTLRESEQIVTPDETKPVPVTQPQLPDAKKVMYTACVLHKYSQTSLVTAIQKLMFEASGSGIPKGWTVRAHHMTVKYKPRQSDIESIGSLLGKEIELEISNWAYDQYCVAVVAKPKISFPLGNAVSHVTVAHSKDVGAEYSNTLLANKANWKPFDMSLNSEMACVLFDNVTTIPQLVNPASPTL